MPISRSATAIPAAAPGNPFNQTVRITTPTVGLEQRITSEVKSARAAIGERAKAYTIHNVGHGHIDMNWMWSWPETVSTTHDTFASILSLMDQYPEFTYSQSQASVYALTEKYHPDLFARIQERVKEGRSIFGLYPPSAETKAEFEAWKKKR